MTSEKRGEIVCGNLKEVGVRARHHARRARQVRDESDLADDVAGMQPSHRGDARRHGRSDERGGDTTAQHEDAVARVAFSTDYLARRVAPRTAAAQHIVEGRVTEAAEQRGPG
jgi:hypothetical protein